MRNKREPKTLKFLSYYVYADYTITYKLRQVAVRCSVFIFLSSLLSGRHAFFAFNL